MIQFCPFTEKDRELIRDVLNTCFSLTDFSQINSAYEVFTNNYYHPKPHAVQIIDRLSIDLKTNNSNLNENLKRSEYLAGIDLPILLTGNERNDQTILIVGEDPLRKKDKLSNEIVLSTPYGIHLLQCREGRQKLYWNIAEGLIDKGYNIYCTDINKLWLRCFPSRKEKLPKDVCCNFEEALKMEIKHFNPSFIITYGAYAAKAVNQIGVANGNLISFLHPSARDHQWKNALSNWKPEITIRATNSNKLDFILSTIFSQMQLS